MESSHVAKVLLPDLNIEVRQIHICTTMRTSPLISLGFICDYRCIIKLEQYNITVQNNGKKILRGTSKKKTGMWEVPILTQQSKPTVNTILSQTSKPELEKYFHAAIFIPTKTVLLKEVKQGLIKTWPYLNEGLINKYLY